MTVVFNAVLVRYAGGYTYVDRSHGAGRRELFLQMGGVVDEQLARQLGAQFLALSRDEIATVVQQGHVRSIGEVPGIGVELGDKIGANMVVSVTSSLALDGDAQVTLELGDARRARIEALNRQLQRAGSGMKSEYSAPAIKDQAQGSGTDTTPPGFSQSGDIVPAISAPWVAPRGYHLSWLEMACAIPGALGSKVEVYRNRVKVGEAVLPAGRLRSVTTINRGWRTGDELVLYLSVQGIGTQDLSVTPRGAMI